MALVLSLVAVIPAAFVGAATTGTVQLNRSVYSLQAETGVDGFAATSAFNVVKVRVTDADVNVERTATAYYTQANTSSYTLASAASIKGAAVTGASAATGAIDGSNASFTVANTPLGDKDGSGAVSSADVIAYVGGSAVTVSSIVASSGTIVLAAAPAVGSTVTFDYNYHKYDVTTPANSPVSAISSIVQDGATFGYTSFVALTGVTGLSAATSASGGNTAITFTYNLVDSIADVPIASNTTTAAGTTRDVDLTETTASSGIFEGTIALQVSTGTTATSLQVAEGDTITVTYADADPAASLSATASVDLTPPTLTLISPTNALRTTDTTPSFQVEISDSGAPITVATDVEMVVGGSAVTEAKTNIVNGFKLTYLQATALADGTVTWYVDAQDAVGNDVNDATVAADFITGSSDKPYTVVIDNTLVASFVAKAGFGVNAAGTARTKSDNTGIQLKFNEALDTATVANTDFDVDASTPTGAHHSATLKNSESFTGDGSAVTFTIVDFAAVDTDADTSFVDEYTVTVAGVGVSPSAASSTSVTVATAPVAAAAVVVTYTFDSSTYVFLTVDAQASDAKPVVTVSGSVTDPAGNANVASIKDTADDDISPTLTVSLDAAVSADLDNDADAEGTVTITSDETLGAAPVMAATATTGTAGITFGTVTAVTGSANTWTSAYVASTSATVDITATGSDSQANSGTSAAVSLRTDVTDPALSAFTPAAVASTATPNTTNQGLDNIIRVSADFGEASTTVVSSTLDSADVSAETFAEGNIHILATALDAGTYTWSITVADAAGNESSASSLKFTVAAPNTFTVALGPGWNLISVPARLDAASLSKVFGTDSPKVTKVRTWTQGDGWMIGNFADGAWSGDILAIKQGVGYWVYSTSADDLSVTLRRLGGVPSAPRPQDVITGWNLIGPQSIDMPPESTVAAATYLGTTGTVWYEFSPDPAVGFTRNPTNLTSGSGYWVWFTKDGQIIP